MSVNTKNSNPLMAFMRQPKIYIRLPSNGEFWPNGSLDISENGEYPVYSMTAKDELMLKVPDALMSGQAVVDVIQNCIPNIKNAWHMPSIDVDTILIALRLATYGEKMTTPVNLGEQLEFDYQVDLRIVLDNLINSIEWESTVFVTDDLTVHVKPLSYKQISQAALKSFETQKLMGIINDETVTEEQKLQAFKESFSRLTEITIGMVQESVYLVESINGSTSEPEHIKEFVANIDKDMFNKIQNHLDGLRDKNQIKPIIIPTPEHIKANGYSKDTIEVPLVFDPSTFFV